MNLLKSGHLFKHFGIGYLYPKIWLVDVSKIAFITNLLETSQKLNIQSYF
ncbi:hypothetical protein NTHI1209_01565 [Haemophilus influenzae]|uniref:Uncharacterized protein n=1 Tax=Haemophilus influenzae TaxID=727 RepID=A0A158SYK2_HAEIF|nr:hypothetical protein NTHI1209_01565 [Haemophilus influenzae]